MQKAKRRSLAVRLTKNQHERVETNAQTKGFKTLSSYIRSLALEKDIVFDKKFDELYNKIVNNKTSNKQKINNKVLTEFSEDK